MKLKKNLETAIQYFYYLVMTITTRNKVKMDLQYYKERLNNVRTFWEQINSTKSQNQFTKKIIIINQRDLISHQQSLNFNKLKMKKNVMIKDSIFIILQLQKKNVMKQDIISTVCKEWKESNKRCINKHNHRCIYWRYNQFWHT